MAIKKILENYENKIQTLKGIEELFDELKPYVQADNPETDKAKEAKSDFDRKASSLLWPFYKRSLDKILELVDKVSSREEAELAQKLLDYLTFSGKKGNKDYYPAESVASGVASFKIRVLGEIINQTLSVPSDGYFNQYKVEGKVPKAKKKLSAKLASGNFSTSGKKDPAGEWAENNSTSTETPETGSENTSGNNTPTETEIQEKVRETIRKGQETIGSNNLAEVEKILSELEAIANGSEKEKEEFNNWMGKEVIDNLKSRREALKSSQTNDNNNQGNQNQNNSNNNSNNGDKLFKIRTKAVDEIITALYADEPRIGNNELSPDYQNWRDKIKQLTDPTKIETFKKEVIINIQKKREEKLEKKQVKNKVKEAEGKTGEELRKDLENLKKNEGKTSYQEQEKEIEELSKKSAQEDPEGYCKSAVNSIRENLKTNQVEEKELENLPEVKEEWKKMKEREFSEPEEIISTEKKITKKIGQMGAQKRFDKLVEVVNKALKSGKKTELGQAIQEIVKYTSSSNVYDQALISEQEKKIKELKEKLENYKEVNNFGQEKSKWEKILPWIVGGGILVLAGGVILLVVYLRSGRKNNKKNVNSTKNK